MLTSQEKTILMLKKTLEIVASDAKALDLDSIQEQAMNLAANAGVHPEYEIQLLEREEFDGYRDDCIRMVALMRNCLLEDLGIEVIDGPATENIIDIRNQLINVLDDGFGIERDW